MHSCQFCNFKKSNEYNPEMTERQMRVLVDMFTCPSCIGTMINDRKFAESVFKTKKATFEVLRTLSRTESSGVASDLENYINSCSLPQDEINRLKTLLDLESLYCAKPAKEAA